MVKRSQEGKKESFLVVAHGDLDGIVSAILVTQLLQKNVISEDVRVVFVQPFALDKVSVKRGEQVIVVDIAVNNRNAQMTRDFISRLSGQLLAWYDHHQGWGALEEMTADRRFVIDSTAPSCAELIRTTAQLSYGVLFGEPVGSLVADATAADTRHGELSERAQYVEQAMKANLSDDSVRWAALTWLEAGARLDAANEQYATIQAETERLAALFQATGQAVLVDAKEAGQFDLTQLLLAGQRLAPFAVVSMVSPGGAENLTIATSCKDVNLVEVFGLPSGAPCRVTLSADGLEEVLGALNSVVHNH